MIKEKKCKGQGLAIGYGCGKMTKVENRKLGLGKMCCYSNWLLTSENGKIKLSKAINKVQKPRKDFEQIEKDHKETSALKLALANTKLKVHAFVRERDKGKPCASCLIEWSPAFQAGHFYKCETFNTLRFNLDNIHGQCVQCNIRKDGNHDYYAIHLPNRIGSERYNALVSLAEIDKHFEKFWDLEKLTEIRKRLK